MPSLGIEADTNSGDATKSLLKCSFVERFSDTVDRSIATAFRRWSRLVSHYPFRVIVGTVIFAVIWGIAFVHQLELEFDTEDLFTPNGARSFKDKDYVEDLYGAYTERARILTRRNENLMEKGNCNSRLLLKDVETARESIQAFFKLYESVTAFEVTYDGEIVTLEDVCIKPSENATCAVTSILDIWDYDPAIINAEDFNPLERINSDDELLDRFGSPLNVDQFLGKPKEELCEVDQSRSSNVEVFAMTIMYINEREELDDGRTRDPESTEWVDGLVDHVRDVSKETVLDSYVADQYAVGKVSAEQVQEDIQLLALGYILILLYTNFVLYKNSWSACKMHLSLISVVAIALATITAFGIVATIGYKVNPLIQILPFLILGLGIDDTFVIVGAYQRIDSTLPVEERISQTLERAGSSILVTSATDCLAFVMGTYTRLPGLRAFSVFAAVSILFDFAFQVTFFIAFLVLEARREIRCRNGAPRLGLQSCCTKEESTGGHFIATEPPKDQNMDHSDAADVENGQQSNGGISNSALSKPHVTSKKICGEGEYDHEQPSYATKLIGTHLASITLSPAGRIVVFLAEGALLAWAIYGCTRVSMNFNFIDWVTPEGSSLDIAYGLEDDFFYGDQLVFGIYTREAEQDYFYHQDELRALKTALEKDPFVVPPVQSWYADFSTWFETEKSDELVNGEVPDALTFNSWLQEFLRGPGARYNDAVLFNSDTSNPTIISSKLQGRTVGIESGEQSIDIVDSLRNSVEEAASSLDPIAYSQPFLFYDGYRIITWETIRNVLMAALGVFIMNVIVLASIRMALIVVSMIGLTDLIVVGYMWYVDEYFNPVTAVNMVLIVGIAVDYSAHIAHAFLVITGTRLERAQGAMDHIGGEVVSGAFTTWLGIAVLGFAQHYFFRSFFKMFFAIIVTGAWHGLVLLPVVLSFVGGKPYASREQQSTSVA